MNSKTDQNRIPLIDRSNWTITKEATSTDIAAQTYTQIAKKRTERTEKNPGGKKSLFIMTIEMGKIPDINCFDMVY